MHPHIPARDLWWLAAGGGAGYGARYVRLHLNIWRASQLAKTPDPTGELLRLQSLYGYNAHSLISIAPDARLWCSPEMDGAIIYTEIGHVWLATGDPFACADEMCELARRFLAAARRRGRIAVFVPITARFAECAASLGLSAVKVGAAPYFDLKTWVPRGDSAKKMRAGVNQARRAGVTFEAVEIIDDALRAETAALCQRWLRARRAAVSFGWLFALDPFRHADHKKIFTARNAKGALVGLLVASPIPARNGWYLEDVLRSPRAPQGTADLLVVEALKKLKAEGAHLATLGTAPLASNGSDEISTKDHPQVERALRMVAAHFEMLYNFAGIRRFKSKFVPTWWESEYVLAPRGMTVPPRVAYAVTRAIAPGGVTGLLMRQVARTINRAVSSDSAQTLSE